MSEVFTGTQTMIVIVCCWTECGIAFAVPKLYENKKREDHSSFHCPNGHSQSFSAESDKARLERLLKAAQDRCTSLDERVQSKQRTIEALDRSLSTTRGHVTRLKKRAAAGKCPCCSEHFSNLASHMTKAHPGYGKEEK